MGDRGRRTELRELEIAGKGGVGRGITEKDGGEEGGRRKRDSRG